MGDSNYIFAVARIRVKERTLLSDADINQLVSMKDAAAVLAALQDKGWGDETCGNDPEKVLAVEEAKSLKLMKELGIEQEVFDVLGYPNLYHNLKSAVKEICTSSDHPEAFYKEAAIDRETMLAILRDKRYDRLPDHMRKAAIETYDTMVKTMDGQMCDVIADRACLEAMEAVARHSKHKILRDYEASTVAVTNIRIAVRAAKTGKSRQFLKAALAPSREINTGRLAAAAAEGLDSLLTFLSSHRYAEAAEALKVSASSFERWCDNKLIASIKDQKRNCMSLGPIVAYYLARKNEIKTVRIILTAKANGLPETAIRERMRDMYV
ncbi:MAG: V-type ATPase subunit [Lachnospiraceae bacterium]|nr:V-type ATPase subunit [Lachnospiraceae bacterium]